MQTYPTKDAARQAVWDDLQGNRAARFPYPPHGRIPNFAGAEEAAFRLLEHPLFSRVNVIKANPDAPQRPLRQGALERGITVYMPTPRLRGGFHRLDPARIPPEHRKAAASLSRGTHWAEAIPLKSLDTSIDLVVTGSVAVTASGKRCGKGHGFGDIEYAILRELGHPAIPVVTTVHPLQVVGDFPAEPLDLPVSLITTPEGTIGVSNPPPAPSGLDWASLPEGALEEMPVLLELREQGINK
ncbi:5-formyltetrahydrofolate cyclo-ligase [Thiohalorhabdus sp. Cl-TMA]|uniref:5-formyltetrahydrofolate cyclo-ligase n=1 Tax=Thiohalorhabdus methylotrophus TaxID=3242694 RepID=A0ABV4TRT9_9GAMM